VPLVPALRPLLSTPVKTSDTKLIVRTAACFEPTAQFLPEPPHALECLILWDQDGYQVNGGNVVGRRWGLNNWVRYNGVTVMRRYSEGSSGCVRGLYVRGQILRSTSGWQDHPQAVERAIDNWPL